MSLHIRNALYYLPANYIGHTYENTIVHHTKVAVSLFYSVHGIYMIVHCIFKINQRCSKEEMWTSTDVCPLLWKASCFAHGGKWMWTCMLCSLLPKQLAPLLLCRCEAIQHPGELARGDQAVRFRRERTAHRLHGQLVCGDALLHVRKSLLLAVCTREVKLHDKQRLWGHDGSVWLWTAFTNTDSIILSLWRVTANEQIPY